MGTSATTRGYGFWLRRALVALAALLALAVVVAAALALWPASTGDLGAEPEPTTTYEDAVDLFGRRTRRPFVPSVVLAY